MIETWFTSDLHFGHKNILEYEKEARPFDTLEQMHEVIIDNWNSKVRPNDVVYCLGDFAFGRSNIEYAKRCNGRKKLVMGNHDTYSASEYLNYFDKLYGVVFWERCVLSHVPVHPSCLGDRWLLNVHGHLHSNKIQKSVEVAYENLIIMEEDCDDKRYFNVSTEQNSLTPIHRDVIIERLRELQQ